MAEYNQLPHTSRLHGAKLPLNIPNVNKSAHVVIPEQMVGSVS